MFAVFVFSGDQEVDLSPDFLVEDVSTQQYTEDAPGDPLNCIKVHVSSIWVAMNQRLTEMTRSTDSPPSIHEE